MCCPTSKSSRACARYRSPARFYSELNWTSTRPARPAPANPPKKYELHLYETYWAPKTEGVANLKDVASFLWDGGLRGILNSMKSFKRAMFGGMAMFRILCFTPLYLCLALLILAALTAIKAVVLAAAGAQTGLAPLAFLKMHWPALASC